RTVADLGVVTEEADSGVRDGQAGPAGAVVEELEPAVLVVRAAGDRLHVDLIEVVLTRVLDDEAGLDRVAPFDERRGVREGVNGSLRRRRVGPAVDLGEVGDRD